MKVDLPFGGQTLQITVPDGLMGQLLAPRALPALQDVGGALSAELSSEPGCEARCWLSPNVG